MIKTNLRAALAVVVAACGTSILYAQTPRGQVKAGFAEATINPPRGIGMTGFPTRDYTQGNQGIHDDVYVTALFVTDGREQVLLVGHDLCFFSRDEADRLKGAIGRRLDLKPSQILLNASHSHAGPRSSHWYYESPDPYYLTNAVEPATVSAAVRAKDSAREVTLWVGEGETRLPMNRRRPNKETGKPDFAPYPGGLVYTKLPVVVFKDLAGKPIYLLFSVSAHASSVSSEGRSFLISADYPGAARQTLKQRLGLQGAVFFQGAGGSSKASLNGKTFLDSTWENVREAGELIASEVIDCITNGLTQLEPSIVAKEIEMQWPLQSAPTRDEFAAILAKPPSSGLAGEARSMWARDMITRLDQGYHLPQVVPITAHGISLGQGFRMIGIEGELVADLGYTIRNSYRTGITMPMGYSNGCQLYLPSSKMIDEGGYEAESYWEYRFPAPLAKGVEDILTAAVEQLKQNGIQ